ncbi:MAG: head decoration protein [Roseiarcus sp.]|jgi:hypothetical protein
MSLTENPHAGSFIVSMADDGNLSTDNGVVASGSGVLQPGTALALNAAGKYVPIALTTPATTDGTQNWAAFLFGRVDATSADAPAVVVKRHAEVYASGLIWPAAATAPQQTAALAQAAAALVVAR